MGPDEWRKVAEHRQRRLETASSASGEQLIKTSGWLTSSLLVINGAGALATLNAANRLPDLGFPAWMFGIGIALSMLSAIAIQAGHSTAEGPIENMIVYWRLVEIHGEHNDKKEQSLLKELWVSRFWGSAAPIIGWLSFFFFVAGSVSLGANASAHAPKQNPECQSLRKDMLAAKPKRPDSRELYVALHCERD